MKYTYISGVPQHVGNILGDAIDILVGVNKAQAPAESDLANHIEGVELQPASKVALRVAVTEILLGPLQEGCSSRVDEGLVRDHGRHGEGSIHAATELGMEGVVGGGEEGGNTVAVGDVVLNGIELGLIEFWLNSPWASPQRAGTGEMDHWHTFTNPFLRP